MVANPNLLQRKSSRGAIARPCFLSFHTHPHTSDSNILWYARPCPRLHPGGPTVGAKQLWSGHFKPFHEQTIGRAVASLRLSGGLKYCYVQFKHFNHISNDDSRMFPNHIPIFSVAEPPAVFCRQVGFSPAQNPLFNHRILQWCALLQQQIDLDGDMCPEWQLGATQNIHKTNIKNMENIQSPTVSSGKCRCLVIFSVIFSGPIQQSGDCHITLCPPATPRGDGHMASVRCQGKGKPWRTGKHRLLQMIYPLKLVIFHSYISLPESDYHNYLLTQH